MDKKINNNTRNLSKRSLLLVVASFEGFNSGFGGHYYSIMAIANALTDYYKVTLVNIGDFKAPALEHYSGNRHFIDIKLFNLRKGVVELEKLSKQYSADINLHYQPDPRNLRQKYFFL